MQIHTGMGDFEVNLALLSAGVLDGSASLPDVPGVPGAARSLGVSVSPRSCIYGERATAGVSRR